MAFAQAVDECAMHRNTDMHGRVTALLHEITPDRQNRAQEEADEIWSR